MSKLKYMNIEVPELEVDEIDPLIYFSVVQCPHCKVILDNEKNLKVTGTSSGRSGFHIGTKAVANCKCPHCKTTFDAITVITSKFSFGLFLHCIVTILVIVSIVLGLISLGICCICSAKWYDDGNTEARLLTKTFGYITGIFFGVFVAGILSGSALETWNKDCIDYIDIDN